MKLEDIKRVGVIGAGLMGHGIAQVFAMAGYDVHLYDVDKTTLEKARDRIRDNLEVFVELGLFSADEVGPCLERVAVCRTIEELCGGCGFIVEAVVEDLQIKRSTFLKVEGLVRPDTILATNTSAISITEIASVLAEKGRFLGTHFWNPPHILPCVEVIKGAETRDDVFETVYALLDKVGKAPVRVLKDVPGFLGNRLQHAMWREAFALCDRGVASPEDIDRVVKYGFGARMFFLGPMETADLAGLDLTRSIHRYLFHYLDNSTSPAAVLERLIAAGALGVKTGRGFGEWPPERIEKVIKRRDRVLLRVLKDLGAGAGT